MKALIIEDETRAASHLKRTLQEVDHTIEPVAVLESIADSISYLQSNPTLDLIFSDIQLSDGLSFEIFKQVEVNCPIIFTTAYDQYAIEAFNTNGIDYLLKPIEEDRLRQALQKVKQLAPKINLEQLLSLKFSQEQNNYKSRFMVKAGDRIKSVPIEEIAAFYSQDKATYLLSKNEHSYAVDYSLEELAHSIDPNKYFRTNRKVMVSIEACSSILAWSNSRLKITIAGLEEPVIVAREKVQEFKRWLDR